MEHPTGGLQRQKTFQKMINNSNIKICKTINQIEG
jgi:hypothetical protein